MSRTQENNNMSLHENTVDGPPVERSQTTDNKLTHRLYPSLPNIDRYEVCVADRSTGEKLHSAAANHPDSLLGDTQSEAGSSGDVRMRAQILIMEEQRQELLSINEKWAKEYRTMVQYYKEKLRDLKALLRRDHFEEEVCENGEKNVTLKEKVKNKDCTWTEDELLKEAEELRAKNSTLTRRGQHQQEEIRRLNKALEEALQTTQPPTVSSETLQDVWKQQAEVYKEDFLKERRDRQKLKEKYLEQEKKFRKVHSELCVLKSQVTRTRAPQPECTCANRATSWEVRQINQHHIHLQRRCTLDNRP